MKYPTKLNEAGLTYDAHKIYTIGQLVLWRNRSICRQDSMCSKLKKFRALPLQTPIWLLMEKVQFMAEVLKVEDEDVVKILTLISGNTLVKVATCDTENQNYKVGDKVIIISKAFNPVIQKI